MKLQKREKVLLGAAGGALVLAILALLLLFSDPRSDETLRIQRDSLRTELLKKDNDMRQAAEESRLLAEWRRRSLPSDVVVARSLYQDWLRVLCDRAHLNGVTVHSERTEGHRGAYTRIPFSIRADAGLKEIVAFLYGFYTAGHLQQIQRLHIAPSQDKRDFDITVTIEAIALPDAAQKYQLSKEPGHALSSETAYRDEIVGRNFFAVYVPPPPARPVGPTRERTPGPEDPDKLAKSKGFSMDFAEFTKITAFTKDKDEGVWRVWLEDQLAGRGKTWQLKEGDEFKVGKATGQVRTISPDGDEVIIQFDGKVRALRMGQTLREGKELKE